MKSLECSILVEPVAKGRARITTFGGHARAYTPKKTANAEALIIASIRSQINADAPNFDKDAPLRVEATFYRSRPKHLPKRVTYPTQKPDCDNYAKLLLDALNHFAFNDDSQVVTLVLKKRFATGQPMIELRIREEE